MDQVKHEIIFGRGKPEYGEGLPNRAKDVIEIGCLLMMFSK